MARPGDMKLSVIIVNYNVRHFLEQCLCSVRKAVAGIPAEVIVIDNNSTDDSISYLQPHFPEVRFVVNTGNTGFAKACNQGLSLTSGKHILFLNPDTIVPEDCFHQCIGFLEANEDVGALGIKMIDGAGKFLKESKRSFPSPLTSMYKLFGLSRLFPHSAVFSSYHLGQLDENKNHEVDVLAGAFMMIKKEVLDKTGGFDETFFMYGEDVDLSYRIQKLPCTATGTHYSNYYFSDSSIIHFKGESTRKGSMNYVRMFYNAMSIFVHKHYGAGKAGLFSFLIHVAIWIRAAMTTLGGLIRRVGLPGIDAGLILLSFWGMKTIWNNYVKTDTQYENWLLWIAFPAFTIVYLITAYYAGLYDRWYKRSELIQSTLVATIVLLAGYSLLPEHYRFSRGILLFGAMLAFVFISLLRWILVRAEVLSSSKQKEEHVDTLIVASPDEYDEIMKLMKLAGLQHKVLGRVAISENDATAIGYWPDLHLLSKSVPFKEVIFCIGGLSVKEIIAYLPQLKQKTKVRIHAAGSRSIVGSDSKDSSGESVSKENGFELADPHNRRLKRLIDISVSLLALISFPLHLFMVKKPFHFFANCFIVLMGHKTWVGYTVKEKALPPLRQAVLGCNGLAYTETPTLPTESLQMLDYWYARDYEPAQDIRKIMNAYRQLGGS